MEKPNIFYYSRHRELWLYMAKRETIKQIVNEVKESLEVRHSFYDIICEVEQEVKRTKAWYIRTKHDDFISGSCYACSVSVKMDIDCVDCPIKIGICDIEATEETDSLYHNYLLAISNIIYKNTNIDTMKEYVDKAIQYAQQIAYAELNMETIKNYKLELK